MKFTINTAEFKRVMQLVKTVAESSVSVKSDVHSICLLRAFPKESKLRLDFSLKGSFLSYQFEDIEIADVETDGEEFRRSVDLGVLSSLKFSGKTVSISLGKNKEGNTIAFSSGKMTGKLVVSHPDIEREVEASRPKDNSVELKHMFSSSMFLKALSGHNYGSHHNSAEAAKRPVRIYRNDEVAKDTLLFVSKDKLTAARIAKSYDVPTKHPIDFYILPKPLQAILNSASVESPTFYLGTSKDCWRLSCGQIDVWYPNIIQLASVNLEELREKVENLPSYALKIPVKELDDALEELSPFTDKSALFSKEDMPIVNLTTEKARTYFSINTTKAKDVLVELEGAEFTNKIGVAPNDDLMLNFKSLSECVEALTKNDTGEHLTIRWWPYQDPSSPTKGKTVCISMDDNYYWISRVLPTGNKVV